MKKFILISLSLLILIQCSQSSQSELVEEDNSSEEQNITLDYQGLGKPSQEFVSNWNQLVSTISEDEETILYFSMNPENVKWTSETKEVLYYSFGDSGKESDISNVFVVNMFITDDVVSRVEFFAPTIPANLIRLFIF